MRSGEYKWMEGAEKVYWMRNVEGCIVLIFLCLFQKQNGRRRETFKGTLTHWVRVNAGTHRVEG